MTVKKGTKVTWKWTGKLPHNVTVISGPKKFHSATQTKGSFAQTLTKPGTYKIVCTIHQALGHDDDGQGHQVASANRLDVPTGPAHRRARADSICGS